MLHFRIAFLLSLCASSLATHPSSSIPDETSTSESTSTSVHTSASTTPGTTSTLSTQRTTSVEDKSTTTEYTSISIQASTSTSASTTTTESSSTSVQTSTTASTTTTSSAASSSATPDLTRLFGEDNRPDIKHLGVVKGPPAESGGHEADKARVVLRAAATLLFGLTKCNAQGEWIKSMFDLPKPEEVIDQGAKSAQVVLLGVDGENNWNRWTKKIDRNNMDKLNSLGIDTSVDEPWWPWALIEGALQAGWRPETNNDFTATLLKILTGKEITVDVISTAEDSTLIWEGLFIQADFSPLVLLQGTENDLYQSVVMSAPYEKDGHKHLKWARPYADEKGDAEGEHDDSFRGDNREIVSVLHLHDLSPFKGRPSSLDA